jgi:glycerate kinase
MTAPGPAVLVAPDKFKGSATALEVAEAIAAGLHDAAPGLRVLLRPVADGGDGTVDAFVAAGAARRTVAVTGPLGSAIDAAYAVEGDLGVIEAAEAAGLRLLEPSGHTAMTATTYGLGELVRAALDDGCRRIVLGLGGSATTDGGAGLAAALGARLLDRDGSPISPGGAGLAALAAVDVTGLDRRVVDTEILVACDVDNPLLGPDGAAAVFAPQKGAGPAEVDLLETALTRYAAVLRSDLGVDVAAPAGGGAAGGLAAGIVAFLGGRIVSGSDLLLDLVHLDEALAEAALVVTGEGSLDAQSLRGKAPHAVAVRAARAGVPVVALAGRVALSPDEVRDAGFAGAWGLVEWTGGDTATAVRQAGVLLRKAACELAPRWLDPAGHPDPIHALPTERQAT